jgi:hypothetical protein
MVACSFAICFEFAGFFGSFSALFRLFLACFFSPKTGVKSCSFEREFPFYLQEIEPALLFVFKQMVSF